MILFAALDVDLEVTCNWVCVQMEQTKEISWDLAQAVQTQFSETR